MCWKEGLDRRDSLYIYKTSKHCIDISFLKNGNTKRMCFIHLVEKFGSFMMYVIVIVVKNVQSN